MLKVLFLAALLGCALSAGADVLDSSKEIAVRLKDCQAVLDQIKLEDLDGLQYSQGRTLDGALSIARDAARDAEVLIERIGLEGGKKSVDLVALILVCDQLEASLSIVVYSLRGRDLAEYLKSESSRALAARWTAALHKVLIPFEKTINGYQLSVLEYLKVVDRPCPN